MVGRVPAIRVLAIRVLAIHILHLHRCEDVDPRDKRGDDVKQ